MLSWWPFRKQEIIPDGPAAVLKHRTEAGALIWQAGRPEPQAGIAYPVLDCCTEYMAQDGDHLWQIGMFCSSPFLVFGQEQVDDDYEARRALYDAVCEQYKMRVVDPQRDALRQRALAAAQSPAQAG